VIAHVSRANFVHCTPFLRFIHYLHPPCSYNNYIVHPVANGVEVLVSRIVDITLLLVFIVSGAL